MGAREEKRGQMGGWVGRGWSWLLRDEVSVEEYEGNGQIDWKMDGKIRKNERGVEITLRREKRRERGREEKEWESEREINRETERDKDRERERKREREKEIQKRERGGGVERIDKHLERIINADRQAHNHIYGEGNNKQRRVHNRKEMKGESIE